MAERASRADFGRWVEPHLTLLARYAARQAGPAERDRVLDEALIRAWQRWSSYDRSGVTPEVWLLRVLADTCARRPAARSPGSPARSPAPVVELVEPVGSGVVARGTRDLDLERAVEGLGRRPRLAVDLHHFVGLDTDGVAEVMGGPPSTVTAALQQARARLGDLLGDDAEMADRLDAAARRWRDEQPAPPPVPLERLDSPLDSHRIRVPRRPRRGAVVAAAVVLVGGAAIVGHGLAGADATPRASAPPPTPDLVVHAEHTVPWRDLPPGHPALAVGGSGGAVTAYSHVSATGRIAGTVHPGDSLVFDVVLTAPGVVSLRRCPDYTVTFGSATTTRALNCAAVPYFASIVRPDGEITAFRPVLPARTPVAFRIRVSVPEQPGVQQVRWTLAGARPGPAVSGTVEVTAPPQG
jgi:RNA polymerase sigma-70 factor (ECF subfamily)